LCRFQVGFVFEIAVCIFDNLQFTDRKELIVFVFRFVIHLFVLRAKTLSHWQRPWIERRVAAMIYEWANKTP